MPTPEPKGLEEISDELRANLWNDFYMGVYELHRYHQVNRYLFTPEFGQFMKSLWAEYLGHLADEYPLVEGVMEHLKEHFLRGEWWVPFDIIELVYRVRNALGLYDDRLFKSVSRRLDADNAAYSFVNGLFVDRMTDEEKDSVEETLSSAIDPVTKHMAEALRLLADRHQPNLANCVKEAISAVEVQARASLNDDSLTLNKAIDKLDAKLELHPRFKTAIKALYDWTSDQGGIRHGKKREDKDVTHEEARLMVVTCSAFVNYLASLGSSSLK